MTNEPLLPPSREVRRHAARQVLRAAKKALYAAVGAFAALADAVKRAVASLRSIRPLYERLRRHAIREAYKDRRRIDRTLLAHPSLRGLDDYLDTFYSPA